MAMYTRWELAPPLSAKFTPGRIGDVVWTYYGDLLVGKRFVDVLRQANASGFQTQPVTLGADETLLLTAIGWGGMASAESKICMAEHCESCGLTTYKVRAWPTRVVDPSRWDRSDIFMVWPLPRFLFVTERVAKAITDAGLSGLVCVPELAVIRRSSTYSPGRLEDAVGSARARQYAASLHIQAE